MQLHTDKSFVMARRNTKRLEIWLRQKESKIVKLDLKEQLNILSNLSMVAFKGELANRYIGKKRRMFSKVAHTLLL